jgi:hypothetical protein
MRDQFDEFSKSVAEQLPRRETLRRFGAVFVGAVLSPLGLEAAVKKIVAVDPCKAFCTCKNTKQKNQCLATCKACDNDTKRLTGSCGAYTCCGTGLSACGGYCVNLKDDFSNCGSCGKQCAVPDSYESGACISGQCEYWCVEGADYCDGHCTPLDQDYENCGACGNICTGSTPYCNHGVCSQCLPGLVACGTTCTNLANDNQNCGVCGNVCGGSTPNCLGGACGSCPYGSEMCDGRCVDVLFDGNNCGACGYQCQPLEYCSWGGCYGSYDPGYGYGEY